MIDIARILKYYQVPRLCPYVANWMLQEMHSKNVPEVFTSANSIKHLEKYASDRNQWFQENYMLEKEFTYKGFTFQYYTKQSV